jgi:hypothetical protein
MEWNLKKMWPAAAASLVAFTSLINAADEMQMRNLENRVTALESRKGSNGMINPPANPKVKEGADIFITGEATFMKAHENGLEYAFESNNDAACPALDMFGKHPKHDFEWGFKVGLGYVFPHDGWDLYVNYTRFNGHSRTCHECPACSCFCAPELFYPTYLVPCETQPCPNVTDACGKWKLRLNRLDVELGREFFVSKWLTLRPFMGFSGVIITQHFNVQYEGGNYVPVGFQYNHKMRDQFRGGGVRGGLNTQWDLMKDWSIYGNLALNVLYGVFHVNTNSFSENTTTLIETPLYKVSNHFLVCRPVLDLGIGLQWEHAFADDSFFMSLHAGWEHHYYWEQNQFLRFFNTGGTGVDTCSGAVAAYTENNGDLAIAGWVFGARFDF